MKTMRKIIKVDEDLCDGCGLCVPACAEGAMQIVDGKVKIISDNLCDGLGACIGECPNNALKIIEREAEEFDEAAVEQHLAQKPETEEETLPCGCPSSQIQEFVPSTATEEAIPSASTESVESALSHWPVQIRLVPSTAPFLKGADLLVLADCVPVAFPTLHRDLLKGRAVMMGCPKLDNAQEYIDKFSEVFELSGVKSVTTVVMEVPCCAGLRLIVRKGMEASGKDIPIREVVVDTRGNIIEQIEATHTELPASQAL